MYIELVDLILSLSLLNRLINCFILFFVNQYNKKSSTYILLGTHYFNKIYF